MPFKCRTSLRPRTGALRDAGKWPRKVVYVPGVERTSAIIPARSKQQALDWSLVLVSQGIQSTIESDPEKEGWRLIVDSHESQQAIRALRQYKLENTAPIWRRKVPWTGLMFDWRSVACLLLLVVIFVLSETRYSYLRPAGWMDNQAVWSGQWWRPFTAVTLHRDIPHLVSNLTAGILLLGLAMGSFGSGIGLLAAFLAGVAGNLAGMFLYTGAHRSLGASGMIFGALGLLTGQMAGLLHDGLTGRQLAFRGLASGFLLLVLLGVDPESDVIAHVGGFLAGGLFGGLLSRWAHRLIENPLANRLGAWLCAGLVILTWWRGIANVQ